MNMTNVFLSRTNQHGAPWLGRSVASGNARQSARTRFSAASARGSPYPSRCGGSDLRRASIPPGKLRAAAQSRSCCGSTSSGGRGCRSTTSRSPPAAGRRSCRCWGICSCTAARRWRGARSRTRCGPTTPKRRRARTCGATSTTCTRCCRPRPKAGRGCSRRPAELRWNPACDAGSTSTSSNGSPRCRSVWPTPSRCTAASCSADVDEEWVEPERARLNALYRGALEALVARLRAARDYAPAIAAAQRLLADDPWREDVLRTLIRLRHEAGDRAGALQEYERFARALRDELGTEPMAETRAAYASIAHDAAPADDARGARRRRGGATATERRPFTSLPFVGREAELAALRERWEAAVAGHGGLVLVGGEAGIGKTRLVRELVAHCEARGAQAYAAGTTLPETVPYQAFATLLRVVAPLAATVSVDPLWLSAIAALAPSIAEHARDLAAAARGRSRSRAHPAVRSVQQRVGGDRDAAARRARRRGRAVGRRGDAGDAGAPRARRAAQPRADRGDVPRGRARLEPSPARDAAAARARRERVARRAGAARARARRRARARARRRGRSRRARARAARAQRRQPVLPRRDAARSRRDRRPAGRRTRSARRARRARRAPRAPRRPRADAGGSRGGDRSRFRRRAAARDDGLARSGGARRARRAHGPPHRRRAAGAEPGSTTRSATT